VNRQVPFPHHFHRRCLWIWYSILSYPSNKAHRAMRGKRDPSQQVPRGRATILLLRVSIWSRPSKTPLIAFFILDETLMPSLLHPSRRPTMRELAYPWLSSPYSRASYMRLCSHDFCLYSHVLLYASLPLETS